MVEVTDDIFLNALLGIGEFKPESVAQVAPAPTPAKPKCKKCGGRGWLSQYRHISNGRCFDCGGESQAGITI